MVLGCLLYTSDAADERSSVDLGGRRIIKKKTRTSHGAMVTTSTVTGAPRSHTLPTMMTIATKIR